MNMKRLLDYLKEHKHSVYMEVRIAHAEMKVVEMRRRLAEMETAELEKLFDMDHVIE